MKKLLLILICLFVSFEVQSKEIILVCKVSEEKLYKDEKSDDEIRAIEKSIFKNFNSKTELFYLDRKRKWLGEKEYSFKKKDLEKVEEEKDFISFESKDEFNGWEYSYFDNDFEVGSTLVRKDLKKDIADFSNIIHIDLNPYDGTITYEKTYDKPLLTVVSRDKDIVREGSPIYNVVLKKGVCKKSKGKLF